MFRLIRHTDVALLELNLLALALIALVPYPTELIGTYGSTKTATVFYAATVASVGIAHTALWWHAIGAGLVDPAVSASYRRHALARGITLPLIFLASIPVAFVAVDAAQIMWVASAFAHLGFRSRYGSIQDPFSEVGSGRD
jgi:uncharacterized membrane protein